MTENLDSRRLDLVRAAQQQWIAALTESITAGFDVGAAPVPVSA